MKKGLTELVFILDRSGSMSGLEADTIGGFNSMIEKQKKEEGKVNVTTVLFDTDYELIHDRFDINIVEPLTEKEYFARGCTALLDAVGRTITKMVNIQKHLPEDYRAEHVIFVITTDGLENASREYTAKKVKAMIEHEQEAYNWEFLFLGANMDAVSEAARYGIRSDRAVTYCSDSAGEQVKYATVGSAVSRMRRMDRNSACFEEEMADFNANWSAPIEEDNRRRRKQKR